MGWLDWPECRNVRDLGGLPTIDGGATVAGALVRSGRHAALTPEGSAAMRAYDVRRIIDLRSDSERASEPSPFAASPRYVAIPLTGASLGSDVRGPADLYRRFLDRRAPAFGRALAAIVDAPPGAVVVHCHAGKDRTGLVVALALSVAGVTQRAVVDDYACSDTDVWSARELAAQASQAVSDGVLPWLGVDARAIEEALDHLETAYGGVRRYLLTAAGLHPAQIAALRTRLVR